MRYLCVRIFLWFRMKVMNFPKRYELQSSLEARRLGLGRAAIQAASDIGRKLGMRQIMLTVIKGDYISSK